MKFSETHFFDIVTTHNHHPSYARHGLGRSCVVFTLFGYWVQGGGGVPRTGTQPAHADFHPGQLKNRSLRN